MPLLESVALDLDLEDLESGIADTIITEDKVFNVLDFKVLDGFALVINREETLADADFVGIGKPISESASTTTKIIVEPKQIVGDVHIDKFLARKTSHRQSQVEIQIAKKAKAVGRRYRNAFINGDATANPDSFDGLSNIVAAGQVINPTSDVGNGGDYSLEDLDKLVDLVQAGEPALIAMHRRGIRFYKKLLRGAGGTDSAMLELENFGKPVLTFAGIPVLPNDWIPTNLTKGAGTALSRIFAMTFGELAGVTGIVPDDQAGIEVENLGTLQTRNAQAIRVLWYAGLALYSTLGLAMLDNCKDTGV